MDRNFNKFPNINQRRQNLNISYIKFPELLSFSYYTNLDLSLSTLGMKSTIDMGNTSAGNFLKPNTLGISLIDNRQDHTSFKKRDMEYNNLFLINDSKKIYPLSYTLLNSKENIDNALCNYNNIISLNIDNDYIKERNSYIYGDYTHLRESDTFAGFFKPDNISTEIRNSSGISIKSTYTDLMNNIKNTNNDINAQLSEEITYIPKFRIMYGSSLSDGFKLDLDLNLGDLTYKDKFRSIKADSTESPIYVDYGVNDFYLIYKILFKYKCNEKLYKYFMFNKNDIDINLNDTIKILQSDGSISNCSTTVNQILSFDRDKSFIYDITYNKYDNGNINGYFYLAVYFDINLYGLNNTDKENIKKNGHFRFQPIIKINGYDKELPHTYITKFVDELNNIQVTKRLYHDYIIGYNYEHHGNYIGTCVLPSNFYTEVEEVKNKKIASDKPIFVYKKELLEFSTNIFNKIHSYRSSTDISLLLSSNMIGTYYGSQIILDNETDPIKFKYPNIYYGGVTDISQFMNHLIYIEGNNSIGDGEILTNYYNLDNLYCTSVNPNDAFSPKKIFTNNIKDGIITDIFSNFNKDFGNESGIRINDIYIPNIFELQFIKLIKEFSNKNTYYSSTILFESNKYYILGVKKDTSNIISLEYTDTEIKPMNFVCYFKIPDINVLNGNRYHIIYSRLLNYECIDYYYTKNQNIIINIQKNYSGNIDSLNYKVVKGEGYSGDVFITQGTNGNMINLNYTPKCLNSEILIYYTDSDYSLNNYTIKDILGNTIHCRVLCKISVKTKSFS